MVSPDMIAQLRQDITTAEDAGDKPTANRLRAELATALQAARGGEQLDDLDER
ncbi:hypothetical protein OH799_01490 [Nocardia sp. NBC_00881]|uniref:hypothetical protein n=1 Tax=Nocardia sp. NBC_00881 TaxID=2975995 RepID=UPI003865C8D0|nr:hypothetical protein OH799_01490 [Nocardia sp. NBC_00881]